MDGPVELAVRHVTGHPDFEGRFRHPVKFNGAEFVEQRLTVEEQFLEVSRLASRTLHVFLERYGSMLSETDLRAIGSLPCADTAEARFWLERLLRQPLGGDRLQKQSRRRRWAWARREMARADGFFSEDEMKRRDPQLFHRLVGRHLDSDIRLSAPMQGSLSSYLMQQLEKEVGEEAAAASAAAAAAARAAAAGAAEGRPAGIDDDLGAEDDDDSDGLEDEVGAPPQNGGEGKRRRLGAGAEGATVDGAAPDDAAVRRARFLKAMRDRFVEGREAGFDYSALDGDSDLDDVVELGRDAEDKYFDDD